MSTDYLDKLTEDFQRGLWGRPVMTITEATQMTTYSRDVLKAAIDCGELRCSRRGKGGKIIITARALATWVIRGERNSLKSA